MYQVSKRTLLALSESLAADLETVQAPIQVSVAFPAAVETAIFRRAPDHGGDGAAVTKQNLRDLLAQGMDPDRAGALILEAAASGRRWISTHPEDAALFAESAVESLRQIASEVKDG
jgi:short-subunit dehydrogenase